MLAWLYNLVIGHFCKHKWKTIQHYPSRSGGYDIGYTYHLQCQNCGDVKIKETRYKKYYY